MNDKLKPGFALVNIWFHGNRILLNPGKCHVSCSRTPNNMINKIHERSLSVVPNDEISSFADIPLGTGRKWNVHKTFTNLQRTIQV